MNAPTGTTILCRTDEEFRAAIVAELRTIAAMYAAEGAASDAPTCQDCPRVAVVGGLCAVCARNADDNHREYGNPFGGFGV